MNSTIENVLVTPEIALEILSQSDHEYQRPLSRSHVNFLAKEMKAGNFLSNTIALCQNGTSKRYLINGQHTLNAIFESGISLTLPIQVFSVESKDDVYSYYARLDKHRKRTRADTFRAFDMENKLGMNYTAVNRYGACANFMLNGLKSSGGHQVPVSDFEVMNFMIDWQEYAKQFLVSIEASNSLRIPLERKEVFSVALITFRYSSRAYDFWSYVATDDGLHVGDPRKTLRKWLDDSGMFGGNIGSSKKKRITRTPESIRAVVAAWNAYIDGRQLQFLLIRNPSLPYTIKDTPYKDQE